MDIFLRCFLIAVHFGIGGNQAFAADSGNTTVNNPPTTISKSFTITGLSIANGATFYLEWTLTGVGGSSNGQGLGIDNFSITAAGAAATKIQVETASDGSGAVVAAQNITAGNSITVYSIQRNSSDNTFVANVATDVGGWTLPTKTGGVVDGDLVAAGDRKSATFTGHLTGTATIRATVSGSTAIDSGLQTVVASTATQVRVETAANGSGTVVPTQNIFVGNPLNVFAITRDAQGNFVANVTADTWSLPVKTGGVVDGDLVPSVPATNAVFTGHTVNGTATIRATSGSLATVDSGTLTIAASTKKFVANSSWLTANNWSPSGIPTSGYDDLVIDNSSIQIPGTMTISSGLVAAQTITFANGFNITNTTTIGDNGASASTFTIGSPGTGSNPLIQINSTSGTITFEPKTGAAAGVLGIALGISGSINVAGGATLVLSTVVSEVSAGTSLTKTGNGTLVLSGADSYTGNTTVSAGTLEVDGSLASGITISSGTLSGRGIINGAVTVNDTLSPSNSLIAMLTFNNGLILAGTTLMDINKSGSTLTSDKAAVTGALTYGGTLKVTLLGTSDALTGGEVFDLFDATSFNGAFSVTNLPTLGAGLNWYAGNLAVDGTIKVNRAPVASNLTLGAAKGGSATFPLAKYASDADGDTLSVGFNTFSSGGSAVYANGTVTYTPLSTFSGTETFNYTVTDPSGASATATVTATVTAASGSGPNILSMSGTAPNPITITFAGIPKAVYHGQVSTDLMNWADLPGADSAASASSGLGTFTDNNPPMGQGYYRTRYVSGP